MTRRVPVHAVHLGAATLLRVSAEGLGTGLVLVVQARTGQPALAGFLQAGVMLPYVVAGPAVGHALDRTARPRAFALTLAGCYVLTAMLLMLMAGRVPLLVALAMAVAVGCTEPIVVALTGALPRFVPAHRLTGAYGLEAATYNIAAIAGPGLAAALAAGPGAEYAGLAVVGSAALGLLLLPLWAVPPAPPTKPRPAEGRWPFLEVIAGGLMVLVTNRVLRSVTCATTVAFLGVGGVAVTAVLFAEHLGEPASAGGRLIAAFAIGSLIGSLASARWLSARRAEWVLLAGMVAFGLALASITLAPSPPWALVGFVLAGVCDGPVFAATLTIRQREAPADRLGQVNTTGGSLKIGSAALGAALAGALAAPLGGVGLLLAIAACQLLGAVAGALLLVRRPNRPVR